MINKIVDFAGECLETIDVTQRMCFYLGCARTYVMGRYDKHEVGIGILGPIPRFLPSFRAMKMTQEPHLILL